MKVGSKDHPSPYGSDTTPNRAILELLSERFSTAASVWYHSSGSRHTRPQFVVLSPDYGVVGIDTCDLKSEEIATCDRSGIRLTDGKTIDPVAALGQRIEGLRASLRGIRPAVPIQPLLIFTNISRRAAKTKNLSSSDCCITLEQFKSGGPDACLEKRSRHLSTEVLEEVRHRLYPETSFTRRRLIRSDWKRDSVTLRFALSQEQDRLARSLDSGVTLLQGVAGSGKSLVLAARARHLAVMHPDWRILLLCFNHALTEYLRHLVGDEYPNVEISTFHGWVSRKLGLRLLSRDDPHSMAKEEKNVQRFFARGWFKHQYDAVLIDEGHDLRPTWLKVVGHVVRPHRGGILIAQSIYRDGALTEGDLRQYLGGTVSKVFLPRNYRNTECIGRFAWEGVFGDADPSVLGLPAEASSSGDYALRGEPVQAVYAWNAEMQAEFIAKQIRSLVATGPARFRDIGVVVARWKGAARSVPDTLAKWDVPFYRWRKTRESGESLHLDADTVKLITMHSATGMEFPIVFIFGVEGVRVLNRYTPFQSEELHCAKSLYVGLMRAADLLYLTYSYPQGIFQRLPALQAWCEVYRYPDDFAL